ncbi:TPA: hypothetical protein MW242_002630 [Acinetobacter baumannii]|nr:hypothetical protein [Acinetobacter baumannii]
MGNLYHDLSKINFSKELYISGNRALNINDFEHLTGDWHTVEAWSQESKLSEYHIMGNSAPALMNTNPFLGDAGIYVANSTLKEMGVPEFTSSMVYAASHARAIADEVIAEAFLAEPLDGNKLFRFITLFDFDDYMPSPDDKQRVYQLLEHAIPNLPQQQALHVQAWLDAAKSKNYEL